MRLTQRDYLLLKELERRRFALGRQLRLLCGFPSQRTCDRRLKLLLEAGYIKREHILYGTASLYHISRQGKLLIGVSPKPDKIKVEQIAHDIAVTNSILYFHLKHNAPLLSITTEKELHQGDGFVTRCHRPDFLFRVDGKTYCIEVELTAKAKERYHKILQDNFLLYEHQYWIVPQGGIRIRKILGEQSAAYPNIEILALEKVTEYTKTITSSPSQPEG